MSIQIECLKCGHTSDDPFEFGSRRFLYRDKIGAIHTCHLCSGCQAKVLLAVNEVLAQFLGVGTGQVSKWERRDGII